MNTQSGETNTIDAVIATFSPVMADATTDKMPDRIHLLRVGSFPTRKYGKLDINASDCEEMVSNFDKGIGLPFDGSTGAPVNFAHQVGLKAAAWIKGLQFDGTNLWGTPVEWSTAGERAIKGKEFKCFSSEFHPRCLGGEWSDPENTNMKAKNVFTGGALTNVPMFTGNRPVTASATSEEENGSDKQVIYISASNEGENDMVTLDSVRSKAAADLNADEQAFVKAHATEFTTDEQTKFGVQASAVSAEVVAPTVVSASAVKGDEGVVSIQASEVKAMNDRLSALEASSEGIKTERAQNVVKKHIARGAIKADQLDNWTKLIMASDDNAALLDGLADNPALAAEQGSDDKNVTASTTAWEELDVKAQKVVADSNGSIDINKARLSVLASDEDLGKRIEDERANNTSPVQG
jgi:hypothetical protein